MKIRHLLPLLLLASACGDTSGLESPPLEPGTYALVSIGGRALPALEPCTGIRTDEARIVLDDARGVQFHLPRRPAGHG